jgi:hypothetical protein
VFHNLDIKVMEIINKKVQQIFMCGLLLVLTSCQSGPSKKIVSKTVDTAPMPTELQISYKALQEIRVAMSSLGYNGDQLAFSMNQAATNAAMQPGAAPGAGLAGALIGGSIMQSSAQSAAQKQKDAPVDQFLSHLEKLNWATVFKSSKLAEKYSIGGAVTSKKVERRLLLKPFVEVTADYKALKLIAEVSLFGKNNKLLYNNFFHVQSDYLLKNEEILGVLNDKTSQELEIMVSELIAPLPALIENDMNGWPNKNLTTSTSIKFTNSLGQYFERGYILDVGQNTIVFKSLRGEVKRIPFTSML